MSQDIDIVRGLVAPEPRRVVALGSSMHSDVADVANVQIQFGSGTLAIITASRATEQKIRTLAITQPDAYIVLDYSDQDIRIHRRAAQEYTLNRESIRYRQASFVEHLFVHKDNPLKLEILHLIRAMRRARETGTVELPESDDIRSLAVALEIERMIREGQGELAWPQHLPWSARSAWCAGPAHSEGETRRRPRRSTSPAASGLRGGWPSPEWARRSWCGGAAPLPSRRARERRRRSAAGSGWRAGRGRGKGRRP